MRAVAILGPRASSKELKDFISAQCRVAPVSETYPLESADAALVFGGDGTVHRHLRALSRSRVPVLMVPHGSGNDFARALGLGTRSNAFAAWNRFCVGAGNLREIDLGVIRPLADSRRDPVLFCCIGGVGLDADANRRANAMPAWLRARGGYLLAVLSSALHFRPQRFVVEHQAATLDESGLLVAFANAPAYGDGIPIAPEARLDDGFLDICFVRGVSRPRLLRLIPTVLTGAHLRLREVKYWKAEHVRVAPDPPLDVYADGEYVCLTPVEVAIVPRALRVIVPAPET